MDNDTAVRSHPAGHHCRRCEEDLRLYAQGPRATVPHTDPRVWDGDYFVATRPGGDPHCPCMSDTAYIPHSTFRNIIRRSLWALARDLRRADQAGKQEGRVR